MCTYEIDRSGSPERPSEHLGFFGVSWISYSELNWLINRLPECGVFVEVGTASGVSAAVIAEAMPSLTVLSVDIFADHDSDHVRQLELCRIDNWRRNKRSNMILWVGTLEELRAISPGLRADAILIDAGHTRPDVANDLRCASTLLQSHGTIFVHDYDDSRRPGIKEATDEFMAALAYRPVAQHWTMLAMQEQ